MGQLIQSACAWKLVLKLTELFFFHLAFLSNFQLQMKKYSPPKICGQTCFQSCLKFRKRRERAGSVSKKPADRSPGPGLAGEQSLYPGGCLQFSQSPRVLPPARQHTQLTLRACGLAHQPAHSSRSLAVHGACLRRPGSAPHKEKPLSPATRNTIGRFSPMKSPSGFSDTTPSTLSCSAFPVFLMKTGNRHLLKTCILHASFARSTNKASNVSISTERLCLPRASRFFMKELVFQSANLAAWALSHLREGRATIGYCSPLF